MSDPTKAETDNAVLKKALNLALNMLHPHESGDSRAVSDEFVALVCVSVGSVDDRVMSVIDAALERYEKAARE